MITIANGDTLYFDGRIRLDRAAGVQQIRFTTGNPPQEPWCGHGSQSQSFSSRTPNSFDDRRGVEAGLLGNGEARKPLRALGRGAGLEPALQPWCATTDLLADSHTSELKISILAMINS
jgi:hypothetical protein